MTFGYGLSVLILAMMVWSALWPRPTRGPHATPTFVLGTAALEIPFMLVWYLLLITWAAADNREFTGPVGIIAVGMASLTLLGLLRIIAQSVRAMSTLNASLDATLGLHRPHASGTHHLLRCLWAFIAPLRIPNPRVRRYRNLRYGPDGKDQLLDVYRGRNVTTGPVFLYFHPGGFHSGSKNRQAKLLLETLASHGWVCVSANYHLKVPFLVSLADAKRVIAWIRTEGSGYGADAGTIAIGGGSAGAQLATHCGVSPNHPEFQPDFEAADTSVSAVIGLYGYYGTVFGQEQSDPSEFTDRALPPCFIIHGDKDPMAPVAMAQRFAHTMRARDEGPVAYAELPGAGHNFDLFASLRHAAVTTAVLEFLGWLVENRPDRIARETL